MGKDSPKQPSQPNPAQVAAAQGASNVETAIANAWLNSGNQVTPYGNVTTNQVGTQQVGSNKVPIFSQTMTLSPEQQKLYEQGVQADTRLNDLGLSQIGRIQDAVSQPFKLDAFGQAPTADAAARDKAYQSILDRAAPQQQRELGSLEARLASQGIGMGSEAYSNAMSDYGRNVNDFRLAADRQAGNEMAQQYGLNSQAYQQAISNALLERQQPLQEFSQFTGASNNFASPQMVSNPQSMIQPTDTTSPVYANYNAQQQNYMNGQANNQSLWGGLAGLGGAALGGWASGGFGW
jgi:hypothetical protein